MKLKRKIFSEKPKKPNTKREQAAVNTLAITGSTGIMAGLYRIPGSTLLISKSTKLSKEVNDRFRQILEKAQKGDPKAVEFVSKYTENPRKYYELIKDASKNSPIMKNAKTKSTLLNVGALGLGSAALYGAHKINKKIEKKDNQYKKELKEWKNKNKNFSNSENDTKKLEELANKGIVGGTGMALLGSAGLLSIRELKNLGYDMTKKKAKQLGNLSKVIIPIGLGTAAYGGYLKHKVNKRKKKNDNKA